ncbi:MAG TPA: hypothetical protein VM433_10660 [Mycobacteriales bacterium]|nr:hypothetical protein [Mycobacteriales bacterium]
MHLDTTDAPGVDAASLNRTVRRVQAYVRREPGAWASFAEHARADPEATARALLALGTVLLDIAANAFSLEPDEMLEKVTRTVDLHRREESRRADSR